MSFGYFPIDSETGISKRVESLLNGNCIAHNLVWGSKDNNSRDECLLNFIVYNNLIICNKGDTPPFEY